MFTVLMTNGLLLSGNYDGQSVRLHWEDMTQHIIDHYVIERRDANQGFQPIGTATGLSFIGSHAPDGINVYRIKVVTSSGEIFYSAVIEVAAQSSGIRNIYLSTGEDRRLVISAGTSCNGALLMYNIAGQTLDNRAVVISKGMNSIGLPGLGGVPKTVRVIVLIINGRIAFSQKGLF
jgi:hypothetical protein